MPAIRSAAESIAVLVVDDHPIVRQGLQALISRAEGMEIVAEASGAEEALRALDDLHPDVVTLDIRLGPDDGLELCREIRRRDPRVHILIVTGFCNEELLSTAVDAGASGYLLKASDRLDVIEAIRTVQRGEMAFDPEVAQAVFTALKGDRSNRNTLTQQERRVLELVGKGQTNKTIAAALFLSPYTVKDYLSSIMWKLHAKNRAEAVQVAARTGLLG